MSLIKLPIPVRSYFNEQVKSQLGYERMNFDFRASPGEEALYPATSLAWRAYKNPISLFIGGVSAVYMQLSEPRVRVGVWQHSGFKENAVTRIQRTGLATMVTVYGQQSAARKMIRHVNTMHERVKGTMPDGTPYSAADPELLNWVHNTAKFSFLNAYDRFGPGASRDELDRDFRIAAENVAPLFGVTDAAVDIRDMKEKIATMVDDLEEHPILREFTDIVNAAPLFPRFMRPMQRLLVRAAASNVPQEIRDKVGLGDEYGLRFGEEGLVKAVCRLTDRIMLEAHPSVMACERVGLPRDFLFQLPANDNLRGGQQPHMGHKASHDASVLDEFEV